MKKVIIYLAMVVMTLGIAAGFIDRSNYKLAETVCEEVNGTENCSATIEKGKYICTYKVVVRATRKNPGLPTITIVKGFPCGYWED